MNTVRSTILISLLIGTLVLVGCGGQQPPRTPSGTPVPVTVEVGEKVTEYDASEAIRSYASSVLGINVTVKSALTELESPSSTVTSLMLSDAKVNADFGFKTNNFPLPS